MNENKNELISIKIWNSTKRELDDIKVHHQQSYDDLIQLLIREHKLQIEEGEDVE